MMDRIKIAYILSVGHSGSSLLDVLLGRNKNAISIGEVKVDSHGHLSNILCTCGVPIRDCEFWQKIDLRFLKFNKSLFNIQFTGHNKNINSEDIVKFYQNIHAESGATLIIDSSKSITRLRALRDTDAQIDLRVIFLERTPFGVVASNHRKGRNWIKHTFMYLINNSSKKQFADAYDPLYLEYETLVAEPKAALSKIYRYLDIDAQYIGNSEIDLDSEKHMLGGNSMLYKPISEIKEDVRWKTELSLFQKYFIGISCNSIIQKFVYWLIGRVRAAKNSDSSSAAKFKPE